MSGNSIGTLVGAVVGVGASFVIPGLTIPLGIAIGSTLGGLGGGLYDTFTANDVVNEQQSLADLKVQTTTYGAVIPQLFGRFRVAGNIIWATEKVEHERRERRGGKGGGPQLVTVTKSYTLSLAIGLADTRVTGPITRVNKAWRDTTLVYDRAQDHAIGFSILDSGGAGYAVGDTGTIDGGDNNAAYVVVTVAAGVVTEISLTDLGTGYTTGATTTTPGGTQPGSGSGLAVTVDIVIANAGWPNGWVFYDGSQLTADPLIVSFEGAGNTPAFHHTAYISMADEDLGRSGRTYNYTFELEHVPGGDESLATVVGLLCDTAGVDSSLRDVTEIPTGAVNMALVSVQAVRAALEQLQRVFRFYVVESSRQLVFRNKGSGAVVSTIPESALAAGEEAPDADSIVVTRAYDLRLPREVNVTYIDPEQEYQQNTQRAQFDLPLETVDTPRTETTALAILSAQAKQLAEELLAEAWIERESYKGSLPMAYAALEPGDRVLLTARGLTYGLVLTETTLGAPGLLEFMARPDAAYVRGATYSPPGSVVFTPPDTFVPGATTPLLLNLPALDANDTTAHYSVAYIGEREPWEGGALYRSTDSGSTYAIVDGANLEAITGTVALATANQPPYVLDTTTSISVVLEYGTLTAVSDLALYNGANLCLIGEEVLAFGVATLTATRTYTLTRLLRGRRGTEWAVSGHGVNETFVLLDPGVRTVAMALGERNVERSYKAVTFGQALSDAVAINFTATAESLVPWTVAQPAANLSGSDWVLTWRYRPRYGGDWVDGGGAGFDADFVGFQVVIYADNTYATALRTITTDGENAMDADAEKTTTYTAAQQTTDFGGPQSTIYYRIYQLANSSISRADNLVGV